MPKIYSTTVGKETGRSLQKQEKNLDQAVLRVQVSEFEKDTEQEQLALREEVFSKVQQSAFVTKPVNFIQQSNVTRELEDSNISIIKLVDALLEDAFTLQASDVHINPHDNSLRVRFRIDGVLQDAAPLPKDMYNEIISRVKILADLRTDEHQAAQDGRFRYSTKLGVPVDVRVSIVPTYYGEKAVLRLLSDRAAEFTLAALGFSESNRKKIEWAMRKPYGMVLVTGPTGSGKTTTLYSILKVLNTSEVSIITIEDPIEYSIEGIDQIQANPRTGLTFANGLRSILRQDPNIIMVGEIRDNETAGLAVNTALTGHLILSTLHTNDAATTLPRLLDMRIEPYLIASTVNIAIAQRLVRKICEQCKMEKELSAAELSSIAEAVGNKQLAKPKIFYCGAGCRACNNTGFRGRVGIHEVLVLSSRIREAIVGKAAASEIKTIAVKEDMVPMVLDGYEKAQQGITTIEEILRVFYE